MLVGDRDGGIAGERRPPGEQLVHQAARGVQVTAGVHPLAARLLRGKVLRGADDLRGLGHRGLVVAHRPGDAEVHHLDVAVTGDHDVARLDVPVHDAGLVTVIQRTEHAVDDLQCPFREQPVVGLQQVADGTAVHVLHDDVRNGKTGRHVLAGVVDRDDGRVVQRCGRLGLAAEPGLERLVPGQVDAERLDGDGAIEPDVVRSVHLGHAATSDDAIELVALTEQPGLCHISHSAKPSRVVASLAPIGTRSHSSPTRYQSRRHRSLVGRS